MKTLTGVPTALTGSAVRLNPEWIRILPALVTSALAALGLVILLALMRQGLHHWAEADEAPAAHAEKREALGRLNGGISRTVELLAVIVVGLIVLRGAGFGLGRMTWRAVAAWATGPGLRILFIFAAAYILVRITDFFIGHLQHLMITADPADDDAERRKRINTLGRLLRGLAVMAIVGTAGLMALREVRIDITPILTGAGVAGVAIGFGAQSAVKDIIAGAFLILENQIRVGDVVTINNKTGLVESIRLRILVLRAQDGTVYVFQNGAITEIANLTKDYAYAVLTVGVAIKENLERVYEVLAAVGKDLQNAPEFAARVLAPMEILGVDSLAGTAVGITMRMKTVPMEQWAVDRELRRRIKARFEQEQITLA